MCHKRAIVSCVCLLAAAALLKPACPAFGDIYEWEWVDPSDPSQGKRESTTLCPDGAGITAAPFPPYLPFSGRDLTKAYLIDANLQSQNFAQALSGPSILTNADLTRANLTRVSFSQAVLTDAVFVDAVISQARFERTTGRGFTAAQLYSTASYKAKDLAGCYFGYNDLSGWNFVGQDLTGADMPATLTGADFTDAVVKGVNFINTTDKGFTRAQLYSTASYGAKDLAGIVLSSNDLTGWDFGGQDLTGAIIVAAELGGCNFSDALVQRVRFGATTDLGFTAMQLYSTASYKSKDLTGIGLQYNDLIGWDFAGQNLTGANFWTSKLAGAVFTDAVVRGACLEAITAHGFSSAQLYSTASYKARDLSGVNFGYNALSRWGFQKQNLTNASFQCSSLYHAVLSQADLSHTRWYCAIVTGADFTDAVVQGANFDRVTNFTAAQLYSTASYKAKDLVGIWLSNLDLTGWNLAGQNLADGRFASATLINADLAEANLTNANFEYANLAGANLSQANLTCALFLDTDLTGAVFTDANVRGARIWFCTFMAEQLYSTANYKAKDLTELSLYKNDLTGWNFANQNLSKATFSSCTLSGADLTRANLSGANLGGATLTGADFTDAVVREANFCRAMSSPPVPPENALTAVQLYSTASYKRKDLVGIWLGNLDLTGWNLAGQNLANARLWRTTLASADLSGADTRGAEGLELLGAIVTNTIRPDGSIQGLDLSGGRTLLVRDYDGDPSRSLAPIPITVQDAMAIGPDGVLHMVFEEDAWDSTIFFAPGIPVALGGSLELSFAEEVDPWGQVDRTFALFNWSGVTPTGTFNLSSSAYIWDLTQLYTAGDVTLVAVAEPGDANHDRCVDGLDYVIWSNNFNQPGTWGEANFNGDALVDGLDYVIWSNNFLAGCPGVPGPVPEPGSAALLLTSVFGLLARRRRR